MGSTDCFSPRCQIVQITVPVGTSLIDTVHNQAMSTVTNANQLFIGGQPTNLVIGINPTQRIFNCPQQQTVGGL